MKFEVKAIQGLGIELVDRAILGPLGPGGDTTRRTADVAEDIKDFYEHTAELGGSVIGSHVMLVITGNKVNPLVERSDLYLVAEFPVSPEEA